MVFFGLLGPSQAAYSEITFGRWWLRRGRQGLQLSGRQPKPPPHQTEINANILKISPEWWRILINVFFSISSPNLRFIPPTVSEKIDAEVTNTAFSITQRPKEFKDCRPFQINQSSLGLPRGSPPRFKSAARSQAMICTFETACIPWMPSVPKSYLCVYALRGIICRYNHR